MQISFRKNNQYIPNLLRKKKKQNKKIVRLKYSLLILGGLLLIYTAQRLILNAFIFKPVQVLASGEAVTIVKEIPVDHTFQTQKQQILAYIVEKFGDRSGDAIALLNQCENHSFDESETNHNHNGTIDYGIFQINSVHEEHFGKAFETNWKANVDVAYQLYIESGKKFTDWTCSSSVLHETNYLGQQ